MTIHLTTVLKTFKYYVALSSAFHEPSEAGVHEELEGTKSDFDNLDNPETRRFHGIVEEDIPAEHDEDFSEEPEESEE